MASNSSTQNNEKAVCSIERSRVTKVKVSVAQVTTVFNDTPATMEKAKKYVAEAAENGSKLVVFPEGFIGGYPRGSTFGNTVGYVPTREGGEQYRKYHASAIDVPGPEVDELGSLANQYDIYIVIGVIERDGYTLYCTVLFFDPKGNYLGKHRKIKPTTCERVIWGCGDGSTIPVFDTPIGKLGAVICWENRMPLLRTAMYAKGIELYCAPTADFGKSCEATMIHIAVEGWRNLKRKGLQAKRRIEKKRRRNKEQTSKKEGWRYPGRHPDTAQPLGGQMAWATARRYPKRYLRGQRYRRESDSSSRRYPRRYLQGQRYRRESDSSSWRYPKRYLPGQRYRREPGSSPWRYLRRYLHGQRYRRDGKHGKIVFPYLPSDPFAPKPIH